MMRRRSFMADSWRLRHASYHILSPTIRACVFLCAIRRLRRYNKRSLAQYVAEGMNCSRAKWRRTVRQGYWISLDYLRRKVNRSVSTPLSPLLCHDATHDSCLASHHTLHCCTTTRSCQQNFTDEHQWKYRVGQKVSPCCSIINRIKTCRRSYFFVKVECRTNHWGKCEQAPVGIKYSID